MDQRTGDPRIQPTGTGRRLRGVWRIAAIAGALIVLGLLVYWAVQPPTATRTGGPGAFGGGPGGPGGGPMPVGAVKVTSGDIQINLNALGTITPLATVTVRPQVSGQLSKINFTEGQMVAAGAVLAEIDPRTYQASLDQAKGQLARDQAQLANALVDQERYKMLIVENSISQQQLDTQNALVLQYQGVVKTDEAAVESAQINLDYCLVRSPVAGRVGLRQVDLGNLVQAGQTTGVAVVTQLQPISALFSIPEDNIGAIMQRVGSGAALQVEAYDRGQTTKLATGTLSTVDNQIDTTTGTVKLRAMFANPDNALFPNQFVNIKLLVDTLHNQTIVPDTAIQRGAAGSFVYVVNPDSTVTMRPVMVGPTDGNKVSIASGVQAGETVVTDGAERLRDGAKVQLPGQTAPAATAGAGQGRGQRRGGQRGQRGGGQYRGQGQGQGQRGQPGNGQPGNGQPGGQANGQNSGAPGGAQ